MKSNNYFFFETGDENARKYAEKVVTEAIASELRQNKGAFDCTSNVCHEAWHGRKGLTLINQTTGCKRVDRRICFRLNNNPKPFIYGFEDFRG